ncbi:MAG: potassium channel family protein, partial [Rhodobacteraceae bacterium]|nr:potassium channel family protein [Paracoccaceae bacterium]
LEQFVTGTLLILYSFAVHAVFFIAAANQIGRLERWLCRPPHYAKLTLVITLLGLWLLTSMLNSAFAWAIYFHWAGALMTFESSVYFTLVSFTTLGFGDVILATEFRILSGLLAANGLLIFGLTTAIMIEIMHKLYLTQRRKQ